ncbi:MAG: NAD+ synthase [Alphaproteobacteria bacterium]
MPPSALTITLAQINPTLGDIPGNAGKMLEIWQNADSDLVIFPEMSLCGYPPEDLVLKPAFIAAIKQHVKTLCTKTANLKTAALISCPWSIDGAIHNAALLIENGEIKHTQSKHHLPNYGVFDEQRIFKAGPLPPPLDFHGHKLGILICEDMWFPDVAAHLKKQGAQILITPNASPFETTKDETRLHHAKNRTQETGLPLVYVNQVGGQDELVFDGGSFVMDGTGALVFQGGEFIEETYDITLSNNEFSCPESVPQYGDEEELYNALTLGLRDYIVKNNFPGVLLGLSGGIDSALSAVIAADALGADKVHCVMMPSPFTSQDSLDDAAALAQNLGCPYETISIEKAMNAFESTIPGLKGTAHENMQSRCRGLTLMALSNSTGNMVLSTGNKSEMAVGYATLYGDMCGGFNALKDLYKTQVYALSKWRNRNGEIIPRRILTKAPTAELRDNQTDQDTLPPYEQLDDILQCLIEHEMSAAEITKRGHDEQTVARVWKMLDAAEYKRRQAPPGVKTTARAFGRDRRYPITNGFTKTIEKTGL